MSHTWTLSPRASLVLDRPRIMAIINLTPDSFYAASRSETPESALDSIFRAIGDGADILDLGGESTRPGADPVTPQQQIDRLVPIITAIRAAGNRLTTFPISIDTTSSRVARACLEAGADCINDVSAGTADENMLPLIAEQKCGIILMHRLVDPARDSYSDRYHEPPKYTDVVADVAAFLKTRANAAISAGINPTSIIIDPGLGFGKTVEDNLRLIRGTPSLMSLGFPVLSALSRKSFVGRISFGHDSVPDERLPGTLALSIMHYLAGARLFRVHDVTEHIRCLRAVEAVQLSTLS